MHINGQPVTSSGVIVVGPGERAALTLPFGRFDLDFRPTVQPAAINLQISPPRITIDGSDNPLGAAFAISAPAAVGTAFTLRMAVYAIGDGPDVVRVVHYTTT